MSGQTAARGVAALTGIGLTCAFTLALVDSVTADRIGANRAAQAAAAVLALTGHEAPPRGDWRDDRWLLCDGTLLLRGSATGYGGPIDWMLATTPAGATPPMRIRAVRVTAHRETPGIADFLDTPEAGWLARFRGRDATGAMPDALTGATVTTRALSQSIAEALARSDAEHPEGCPKS